jgi:exonuclease SbcC
MRLRSLTLWNFRRFGEVSIEFPDGVIGIIGPNGIGKSTLIEAIAWAIYGHPASRTKKEQIKRVNAKESEGCGVTLEFYLGRDEYIIRREMVGQNLSPKVKLLVNGELLAAGERQVTSHLEGILGMDHQSFVISVFARQRELNALSSLGPEERKRLILRMLKIDTIKKALEALRSRKNANKKRMEGIKEAIIDENGFYRLDILKKDRKACIERISEITKRYESRKKEMQEISVSAKDLRSEFKKMEQKLELHNRLNQVFGERMSDLKNKRMTLSEIESSIRDLARKKEALEGMLDDERGYYDAKAKKEVLEAELLKNRERNGEISKEELTLTKELDHLKARLHEMGVRKEATYLELKALKEADSRILALKPIFDVIKDLEKLLKLRDERAELEKKIESIKVDIKKTPELIQGTLDELESLERERKDLEKNGIELSTRLKEVLRQITKLEGVRGICPTCQRALTEREKKSILDALSGDRDKIECETRALTDRLAEINALDLEGVRSALATLKTANSRVKQLLEAESDALTLIGGDFGLENINEIQKIRDEYQKLKGKVSARSNLNETFATLNRDIIASKRSIDITNRELEAVKIKKQRSTLEVKTLEAELLRINQLFKRLEEQFNEIIALKTEVKRLFELEDTRSLITKEIEGLERDIAKIEDEIRFTGFNRDGYEALKIEKQRLDDHLHQLEREVYSSDKELSIAKYELKSMDDEIKEQNRLIELMDGLKEEVGNMARLEEIFKHFEAYMISSIRPFLSEYASTLFSNLTDGRYNGIEIGEAYDIMIHDSGIYYDLKRFSGGETDLANLCLRLAISNIVSGGDEGGGFEFLVLDEIFGSQDAERKRNIIRVLEELSRRFRQIFLITHVEDVKDYLGSFIRVVEVEEGVSGVEIGL